METSHSFWHPKAALIGRVLDTEASQLFDGLRLQHQYLHDWAGGRSVEHKMEIGSEGAKLSRIEVSGERIVHASCEIAGSIVELVTYPAFTISETRGQVEIATEWRVETENADAWEAMFRSWASPLRDLVSFASTRPALIEQVVLRVGDSPTDDRSWVELMLRLLDLGREKGSPERRIPRDFLFTLASFPAGLEQALRSWFALRSKYSPVLVLILGVDYAPFMYDDQRFLSLCQAAEVFHTIRSGGLASRGPNTGHESRKWLRRYQIRT